MFWRGNLNRRWIAYKTRLHRGSLDVWVHSSTSFLPFLNGFADQTSSVHIGRDEVSLSICKVY